jgi:hypothetical protein
MVGIQRRHEPIIRYETYKNLQDRLNGASYAPHRKALSADFPLPCPALSCADTADSNERVGQKALCSSSFLPLHVAGAEPTSSQTA